MHEPLTLITTYFRLVDSFSTDAAAYSAVLHPDIIQTEYPNNLYRTVQHRTFSDILDNLRVGRELLTAPHFEVRHTQLCPDGTVLVEGEWQATVINDVGALIRGQRLLAQLSLVFEFKDGKIYRQRRYPCYEMF